MLSVIYAEYHNGECHYTKCHCAEWHFTECHYAEFQYVECHYAERHFVECHYAECHYAECCGASLSCTILKYTTIITCSLIMGTCTVNLFTVVIIFCNLVS
jgi:hypothetical protein